MMMRVKLVIIIRNAGATDNAVIPTSNNTGVDQPRLVSVPREMVRPGAVMTAALSTGLASNGGGACGCDPSACGCDKGASTVCKMRFGSDSFASAIGVAGLALGGNVSAGTSTACSCTSITKRRRMNLIP